VARGGALGILCASGITWRGSTSASTRCWCSSGSRSSRFAFAVAPQRRARRRVRLLLHVGGHLARFDVRIDPLLVLERKP
ncbi:MAG: hypothetical protein NDI66_06725, partial [Pseudomonas sp.]|nr:hypothetical protein [Pseudomonas sp.]